MFQQEVHESAGGGDVRHCIMGVVKFHPEMVADGLQAMVGQRHHSHVFQKVKDGLRVQAPPVYE